MKFAELREAYADYRERMIRWHEAIYRAAWHLQSTLLAELDPQPPRWRELESPATERSYVEMRGANAEDGEHLNTQSIANARGDNNEVLVKYTVWAEAEPGLFPKQGLAAVIAIKLDGHVPLYARWNGERLESGWMNADDCVQSICDGIAKWLTYDPAKVSVGRQVGFLP